MGTALVTNKMFVMVQTIYLRHVNLVRNIEKQIWIVDSDADFTLKHLDKFDESNS